MRRRHFALAAWQRDNAGCRLDQSYRPSGSPGAAPVVETSGQARARGPYPLVDLLDDA
jgi:hypothetical protein